MEGDKPIAARPSFYALCFYDLKEIAIKYGYNLVLHGSLNRDLDLIAIPWEKEIGSAEEMIDEFAEHLGGLVPEQSEEAKNCFPHGRQGYTINLNRGGKWTNYRDHQYYLDISVVPH